MERYRSGWWLEQKYWAEGWTQAEIAVECDVSPRCIRNWMQRRGIETRKLVGENHPQYGQERDEGTKAKISETLQGREFSEETIERFREARTGPELPDETRAKISETLSGFERSDETREKMSEAQSGENNPRWKGGPVQGYGSGWKQARNAVNERDEVCQNCGHDGREQRLEVHHIVPVRLFVESESAVRSDAHELGNLVLLCRSCHWKAETDEIGFASSLEPPE